MNIKYRIIEVHEAEHSFVVRYYTDIITEEMLASQYESEGAVKLGEDGKPARCRTDYSLTVYKTDATEEEIDLQIHQAAPVAWLQMQEDNLGKTTDDMTLAMGRVHAKKQVEHTYDQSKIVVPPPIHLTDEYFHNILNDFLKKSK